MAIKRESIAHEILSSYWHGVGFSTMPLFVLLLLSQTEWLAVIIWIIGVIAAYFLLRYFVVIIYKKKSRYKTIKEIYGKGVEYFAGVFLGGVVALAWFFIVVEFVSL
jgi:hypothetical protein